MPTDRSMRQYWLDHFCAGDRGVIERFIHLTAADCAPLLAELGHPQAAGVDYESAENRVFGFGDVVIKFFRPGRWSLAALQDEHAFLTDLRAAGVAMVDPIGTPGTWQGIHYQRYATVPQPFTFDREVLPLSDVRAFVHLVARMHAVGARRDAPHRPRLEPEGTCQGLLDVVRRGGFLPADIAAIYADCLDALAAQLTATTAGVPMQRIHNDPGTWNVLWRPEGPLLMDLDDFDVGPVAIDLATMHFPWRLDTIPEDAPADEKWAQQRALVLALYREVAEFPESWEAMFDPLRTLRGVFFDAWFSARWRDPGFAEHYPKDNPEDPAWWAKRIEQLTERLQG